VFGRPAIADLAFPPAAAHDLRLRSALTSANILPLQTGLKIFQGHEQHAETVAATLK
jgi:hypothetical protein